MERRHFMQFSGCLAVFANALQAEVSAVEPSRLLTLFSSEPGSQLQDAVMSGELIYYLKNDHPARRHVAGCVDLNGVEQWAWTLPQAVYLSIGVRPSGSIVFQRLGDLEEYERDGRLIRRVPLAEVSRVHALVGDEFVRLLGGQSLETKQLADMASKRQQHRIAFESARSAVLMEVISSHEVIAIDQQTAELASFDLKSQSLVRGQIEGPEVRASLAHYGAQRDQYAKEAKTLRTISIIAAGPDDRGNLFCLVSPYKLESALILRVSRTGHLLERLRVSLPDRTNRQFGIPFRIFAAGEELYIIFAHGGVSAYEIS